MKQTVFFSHCLKNRDLGHHCYMSPLSEKSPRSDKVLYVFYDFETTQDTKCGDASYEHVPNLVCVCSNFVPCARMTLI